MATLIVGLLVTASGTCKRPSISRSSAPRGRSSSKSPTGCREREGFQPDRAPRRDPDHRHPCRDRDPGVLNQRNKAYDAAAKSNIRTAATAEETYATDNNGAYTTETLSAGDTGPLAAIAPTLKNAPVVKAVANSSGYTITATSLGNGNDVFTYTNNDGTVTRNCSGSGGGCPNSTW